MTDDEEITADDLCPLRPFPHLSACIRLRDHEGRCRFAKGTSTGAALTIYEQGRGHSFRAIMNLTLERGARLSRVEAHAAVEALELARAAREARGEDAT